MSQLIRARNVIYLFLAGNILFWVSQLNEIAILLVFFN